MSVRETHILLDFIADADPLREVNREINNTIRRTRDISRHYDGLTDASKIMMREMNRGWRSQDSAFMKYRNQLIAAEYEYHNLARGTAFFGDETHDLIKAITKVGKAHKKATDGMMKNNDMMRRSFYKTIGTFANMTPQADRNADALKRMNNPLYNANRAALSVVGSLNRMANNANTARAALELLGPTANMKELIEEQRRLNRGLGAMTLVAIGAGVGAFFLYKGLHKAAMGNEEYANAWTKMKEAVREAFQPMVDVFMAILIPVYNFIHAVAHMATAFNKAHPTIAKFIQGTMLLVPALTLLLLPLGLGVGLIKGYALAFGFFFKMIAPLVTFLATMSATVWIVAAVIIGLGLAFVWAWNNVAWFRDGIIAAWEWIKAKSIEAFAAIKEAIMPAIQAIVTFGAQKLAEFRAFWDENGAYIMLLVKTYFGNIWEVIKFIMSAIKANFQIVWPVIVGIIKVAWALIQTSISMAINIVMGIIKTVMALIRGDWSGAWSAITGIFTKNWEDIKKYMGAIDLQQIGADIIKGLIKGITSMIGAVTDVVGGIVDNIKNAITGKKALDMHSPSVTFETFGKQTWQGYNIGQMDEMRHVHAVTSQMAAVPTEYASNGNTSTSSTTNSNKSVVFSPVIHVNGGEGSSVGVKAQVKEALDEFMGYINTVYATDGDY